MRFDAFIGGTYTLPAIQVDCQETFNLYAEAVASEGGRGEQQYILVRAPGAKTLQTLPEAPHRGAFAINGRCFTVCGGGFYELTSPTSYVKRGTLPKTTTPVQMKSNTVQITIVADGLGFLFTLGNNAFAPIADAQFPGSALGITSVDTRFFTINQNTTSAAYSALLDGSDYVGTVNSQQADNLIGVAESHNYLWLFGSNTIVPCQDTGDLTTPFQRLQGATIEMGLASTTAITNADNTLFWLGSSQLGPAQVFRADGFLPLRVSNHAMESAIQSYSDLATATSYSYQEAGHTFIRFDFAKGTWLYDVATKMWHRRGVWNAATRTYAPHRGRYYANCFGLHLTFDGSSGAIYDQSLAYADDAGTPIEWLRRTPHIEKSQKWIFYKSFQLLMQTGGGLPPAQAAPDSAANMLMNAQGLVVNAYNNVAGRGDYFNQASGTSEGQFLYALGMFDAYKATGNLAALTNAQLAISNIFSVLYRGNPIPAAVDQTHIFAPHWLFNVKSSFAVAQIWYVDTFLFTGGVGVVTETRGPVRYIFQVTSVGATLLWDNPYAPLTSGTGYAVASTSYTAGVGTTVTLTTNFSGTLRVIYSTQTGQIIPPGTPYEAWPDWRTLNPGEIDSACDTYSWAYRMFRDAGELIGGTWSDAARATLEQAAIVYNVDDARDWIKLAYTLNPFSDGSRFQFNSRTTPASITCDGNGDVLLAIVAGAGETQYGNASINDTYNTGDSTTIAIGSDVAVSLTVYIDPTSSYVPANRYSATLALDGSGVQNFTLTAADFKNPANASIPAGLSVYTFGLSDLSPLAHTITLGRVRQLPHRNITYYPGALPFTANFLGSPATLIDWRGPAYVGYQSPWMWKQIGNVPGIVNSVQMMADAQAAWHTQTGQLDSGPFAPVFYFDRSDAVQYGPPNTFGWNGPDPNTKWAGYQYRPLAELAELLFTCDGSESYYAQGKGVVTQFLSYLYAHWLSATAGPPTDYPQGAAGQVNYPEPHFVALITRTVLFMDQIDRPTQTGPLNPIYSSLLDLAMAFWTYWYQSSGTMAGTFCSDVPSQSWFGFWHGEILRTLAQLLTWSTVNRRDAWAATITTWINGMVGFAAATVGPGVVPSVAIRWSDDGGETWSTYHNLPCGAAGQYSVRVRKLRCGRGRNRVWEASSSDAIPLLALIGVELDAELGTS